MHYQRARVGNAPTGARAWRALRRCQWCGDSIAELRIDAKYCSTRCTSAWKHDADPARHYAHTQAWRRRHPEARAAGNARARASHHGCLTASSFKQIQAASADLCVYCGMPGTDFDHFVPLTKGGANCVANIVLACEACNSSKYNLMPTDWRPSLAGRVSPPLNCPQEHQEVA